MAVTVLPRSPHAANKFKRLAQSLLCLLSVTMFPLANPAAAQAQYVLWAAAVWDNRAKDANWFRNHPSQTELILAIQRAGWPGYQLFHSGQCGAIAHLAYGSFGTRYSSYRAGVSSSRDGATREALGINIIGGSRQLLGTYCQ